MMARRTVVAGLGAMVPALVAAVPPAPPRWQLERELASGLSAPVGLAIDPEGGLLVANWGAGTVLVVAADGRRSTLASGLNGPSGLALGPQGEVYVASYHDDLVWRIAPSGRKEVFVTGLGTPAGLSLDRQGRLLIANRRTQQVLAADAAGRVSVAIEGDLHTPVGAVQLADGSAFVSSLNGGVSWAGPGSRARTVSQAFRQPGPGIAAASPEAAYVVDYGGTAVKRVGRDGSTVVVADGFRSPVGLALSPQGDWAVVADWGSSTAYRLRLPRP